MNKSITLENDILENIKDKELFENLTNKSVLITGATGLIGSMLARTLCYANDKYLLNIKIIAHIRNKDKALDVLGDLINRQDLALRDDSFFENNEKCDYIIHSASPTRSDFFVKHPVETIDFMVESTSKILCYAKNNNVKKVVYLSSMEQYGIPYEPGMIMTEDKYGIVDHLTVRSCYPESKRLCECYCKAYSSEYNLNVSIARLSQTFGAGVPVSDNRVFMLFARNVINDKDIILHTKGESTSNFCYLTDTIKGILFILNKGISGEAYNVCNDSETMTIAEIAKMVIDKIAKNRINLVFDIPEDVKTLGYAPSTNMFLCSKKLESIGWKANVTAEEAYRRLIKYLTEVDNNE